jgi:hypothetical protein
VIASNSFTVSAEKSGYIVVMVITLSIKIESRGHYVPGSLCYLTYTAYFANRLEGIILAEV